MKKIIITTILLFVIKSFSQNTVTEINTKNGIAYITNDINYPTNGIYLFKVSEPIVELNSTGNGFYQQHGQPKRAIMWGFECNKTGGPKFVKGFDNLKYNLFYKYTDKTEIDVEEEWNKVEFSIHLNSMKMFINGERQKTFTPKE